MILAEIVIEENDIDGLPAHRIESFGHGSTARYYLQVRLQRQKPAQPVSKQDVVIDQQ
jgi:hypothetical protein